MKRWLLFLLSIQVYAADPTCELLAGQYHGVLELKDLKQWQWLKLDLTAKPLSKTACAFEGSVDLVMGPDANASERQTFKILVSERALPGKREDYFILLTSDEPDGLVLELIAGPKGFTAGNLYSKLLGFMGSFRITKGTPHKSSASFVPALGGSFVPPGREGLRLRLEPKPSTNGVGKQGTLLDTSNGTEQVEDTVFSITRDVASNWLTLETEKGLLVGYASQEGLFLLDPMFEASLACSDCETSRLFRWERLKFIK